MMTNSIIKFQKTSAGAVRGRGGVSVKRGRLMKSLLILILTALPAAAQNTAVPQEMAVPVQLDSSAFNNDVESVSEKIRRLIWESRRDKMLRELNSSQNDPEQAQRSLDTLAKEYPELKKEQPRAFEYHQGRISLFKRDYKGAHAEFDTALRILEEKYQGGNPPQGKYYAINAAFMSDLYMGRGVSLMCMGKDQEALKDMNRAIMLSPKARAYMQAERARALIRLRKYQEASDAYDTAYHTDPKWAASSGYQGQICSALAKKGLQPQACKVNN